MMLGITLLFGAVIAVLGGPISLPAYAADSFAPNATSSLVTEEEPAAVLLPLVPLVPLYSQFRDIHSTKWQKVGCGVTSLAMIIAFYHPGVVSVDTLLREGIASGAYLESAGWKHRELALLARPYGLEGKTYDLSRLDGPTAFAQFETLLKEGPVIASVYYHFDPKSTIPHLVVINGIDGDSLYYNDPSSLTAGQEISVADFMKGWKKRFIVVRPEHEVTTQSVSKTQ